MIFIRLGTLIPAGNRCCSYHLYNGHLSYEAMQMIDGNMGDVIRLDSTAVIGLLTECCDTIRTMKSFNFDDPASLDSEAYYNLTGLGKGNINNILNLF